MKYILDGKFLFFYHSGELYWLAVKIIKGQKPDEWRT
jgi:hypothetical protein